ncbi:MAG TPA: hypothetical protein VGN07_09675 [Steroidobacteraceae bacterium]|jgi:hypothetical protein
MSNLALVLIGLFLLALIAMVIVVFSKKKSLQAALAALVGILGGMVASITLPSAEGSADVNLHFGQLGDITAKVMKVNPVQPTVLWGPAFVTIGILAFAAMYFLHTQQMNNK